MKIQLEDVSVTNDNWTQISLSKLTGQHIKDIVGYVSMEFGDPVFNVSQIILGNGDKLNMEGEHDIAFIGDNDEKYNLDDDTLENLYRQENGDEYEDDEDSEDYE